MILCLQGGLHIIGLLDTHVAIASVPLVCGLEIFAALYTYGAPNLSFDVLFMTGQPLKQFWIIVWKYVNPVIMAVRIIFALDLKTT